jgi:ribosomal protein S18 acetylase RimI-like enzyme
VNRAIELRQLESADVEFLRAMFLETVYWREDAPRRSLDEVLAVPDLARYVVGWGRPGDAGLVAVSEVGVQMGAAWYRLFDETDHGYGFVSPTVPELGIAMSSDYRGQGLGRILMRGLIRLASDEARPGLSLSVEQGNLRAIRLYESLGFSRVGRVQTAWTMLLPIAP